MKPQLLTRCCLRRYRLYPEVHFPVQYLDCLAAAKHFLTPEVLSRYEVDPERVGMAGDSAGGNLAAAVVQEVGRFEDALDTQRRQWALCVFPDFER